jgi:hypothetical protein
VYDSEESSWLGYMTRLGLVYMTRVELVMV